MIHQHIYATPPPGMSEAALQDYRLNAHAVRFAAKIPQIAGYRLGLRVPCSINPALVWSGCAEIWLRHDAEYLALTVAPVALAAFHPDAASETLNKKA